MMNVKQYICVIYGTDCLLVFAKLAWRLEFGIYVSKTEYVSHKKVATKQASQKGT